MNWESLPESHGPMASQTGPGCAISGGPRGVIPQVPPQGSCEVRDYVPGEQTEPCMPEQRQSSVPSAPSWLSAPCMSGCKTGTWVTSLGLWSSEVLLLPTVHPCICLPHSIRAACVHPCSCLPHSPLHLLPSTPLPLHTPPCARRPAWTRRWCAGVCDSWHSVGQHGTGEEL